MADIDAVIKKCVDDIWKEYDKDNVDEALVTKMENLLS